MIQVEVERPDGTIGWRVHIATKELADAFVKNSIENGYWGEGFKVLPYVDLSANTVWKRIKKAWSR